MKFEAARRELERVFTVYPSLDEYLNQQKDPQATVDAWRTVLTGADEVDVVAVVDGIVDGTVDPLERFDTKDRLVINIRRKANDRRRERFRTESEAQRMETTPESRKIVVDCVHRINQARRIGAKLIAGEITHRHADEAIQVLIETAPEIDELAGERVLCVICCDRGLVLIAHPDVTRKAARESVEAVGSPFGVCMVACCCSLGDPKRADYNGRSGMRAYNEQRMCRVGHNSDMIALTKWLAKKYERLQQTKLEGWE